mmetsp:Transcript_25516/g.55460  ORF Transcript_25516/g.55460 Transcript_25516/m.55460 type:complete len:210 (-) Transcript_25516:1427-2056(-)
MRQVEQRLEGRPGLGALTAGGALGTAPLSSVATAGTDLFASASAAGSGSASSPSAVAPSSGDVPSPTVPSSSGVSSASDNGRRIFRINELVQGCINSSEPGTGATSAHRCCISVASVIPTAGNGVEVPASCSGDSSSVGCHSTKFVGVFSWCGVPRRAPLKKRGTAPVPEVDALLCAAARSCSRTAAASSGPPEAATEATGTGGSTPSP